LSQKTVSNLLDKYVRVCNEALFQNKDRFPFKQILGSVRRTEADKMIEVKVENAPDISDHIFKIHDDQVIVMTHSECECERSWSVSKKYLENVVHNPQTYINNPALIDWDWMYSAER